MIRGLRAPWAFVGLLTSFWKLALLASLALVFFGRADMVRRFAPRAIRPWLSTMGKGNLLRAWFGERGYLALKVLFFAALAAWVLTRITRIGL